MSETRWKPIPGYESHYLVSENGEVWSVRRKRVLTPATDKYGYLYFVLSVDGVRKTAKAHRLVAMAFIENYASKATVNHKNGVRTDNRVANLEWATPKEQIADARGREALPNVWARTDYWAMGAKRNFGRKKTAVYCEGRLLGIYDSLQEAASANCVNYSKASECANGRRNKTGGKQFCYV